MIRIDSISKKFKEVIFENFSLNISKGKIIGILGLNGSGKTTLLKCLAGIYKVDHGSILIDEENVFHNEKVKQKCIFYNEYYPIHASLKTLKEIYKNFYSDFNDEKYEEYIDIFHLDENTVLKELSKGILKVSFLVLYLSCMPKVLLLDETFDGLDPVLRKKVKEKMIEYVYDEQAIVFVASHSISDLESICDTYLMIENKGIISSDTMQEQKENYHKFQVICDEKEVLNALDIVFDEAHGKVHTLIIKGNYDEIMNQLHTMKLAYIENLDLSLEELFVAKVKGGQKYV